MYYTCFSTLLIKSKRFFFILFLFSNSTVAQFVELNALNALQPASEVPQNFSSGVSYSNGNTGYVCSGGTLVELDFCTVLPEFIFSYNPITEKWNKELSVPSVRMEPVVFEINGTHFFGLGKSDTADITAFWKHDSLNGWVQVANFPGTGLINSACFVINNKAYLVCGEINIGVYQNTCWEYDPALDLWTLKNPFPGTARSNPISWSIANYGYVGMGIDTTSGQQSDLWKFDPSANTWTPCSNYTGSLGNNYAFSIDTIGYVHTSLEFWSYSPSTDTWTSKTQIADTINSGVPFSANNKGYLLIDDDKFYEYNPATDNWISIYDTIDVSHISYKPGVIINGKAYSNGFIYDPSTDTWSRDTSNATWLFNCSGFAYALRNGNFEQFDPSTNSWMVKTLPPANTSFPNSIFQIADSAYFTQGFINGSYHSLILWIYDIQNDLWFQRDTFNTNLSGKGFSINNKGYYGLGWDDSLIWSTNAFYEYDPISNSWTQKADFSGGARFNPMAAATSTKGYMGLGTEEAIINPGGDIHEYDPLTDTWTHFGNIPDRNPGHHFVINDILYVGGGSRRVNQSCGGIPLFDFYRSDSTFHVFISEMDAKMFEGKVYPNPASATLNIQVQNKRGSDIYQVSLFNILGHRIKEYGKYSGDKISIELGVSPGNYFLEILNLSSMGRDIIKIIII